MKKYNLFILVFGVVVMLFTSCKDSISDLDNGTNSNGVIDYAKIYKEAMSELYPNFDLNAYQGNESYQTEVDESVSMFVEENADIFGEDVLVLSSFEIGKNGEGLTSMLNELNDAMNEGGDDLERCYTKLKQRKRFKSPSIERTITKLKEMHLSSSIEMETEDIDADTENQNVKNIRRIRNYYDDDIEDDPSNFTDIEILSNEDLVNDRNLFIAGSTVNIYLNQSQLAMPVTTFAKMAKADASVVSDLSFAKMMTASQESAYCNKILSLAQANNQIAPKAISVVGGNNYTKNDLLKSGWERGDNGKHLLYANYEVNKLVIEFNEWIMPVSIYCDNYKRPRKCRIREKSHTDVKYTFRWSMYKNNRHCGTVTEPLGEFHIYGKRPGVTVPCDVGKIMQGNGGILPDYYGLLYIKIEASNGQGCHVKLEKRANGYNK